METNVCPNCGKHFQYRSQFMRHNKSRRCYRPNRCVYCSKTYSYVKSLRRHIEKCPYRRSDDSLTEYVGEISYIDKETGGENSRGNEERGSGNESGGQGEEDLKQFVNKIANELEETKRDLNKVKEQPTYVNIENLYNNITIISGDFYGELKKCGRHRRGYTVN